jgi:hypothetical protein
MLGSVKTGNRSLTPFSDPFLTPFSEWVSAAVGRRFLMPTLRRKNRAKPLAASARER